MKLNQVTIPVLNIDRSIAFYEALGLELIVYAPPHYARFQCPDGGSSFSLHQVNELPAGEGIWVYFELDDLDKYTAKLVAAGIVFEELPVNKPWLWREARLKDPDNNQLILYFAGINRLAPPWKIKK